MSDPMTNAEVEDVLSSIRRLVSDDKPAEPAEEPAAANDRLVLTPSLRVMDDDTLQEEAHEEDAPTADEATFQADLDALIETVEAADVDVPETVEPDAPASDDTADDAWADMPEADAATADADWVEEVDTGYAEEAVHADAEQTDTPDAEEVYAEAEAFEADPVAEEAADAAPDSVDEDRSLSDKIAALETLIAGRADEWEPDDAGTDAYAGTEPPTMEWEDADVEPSPQPTFAHHAHASPEPEPAADPEAQIFSSDEDVLDEDALRDLISDIVREELQGALGERITRNVRKLVRREIHRALAAQDLE